MSMIHHGSPLRLRQCSCVLCAQTPRGVATRRQFLAGSTAALAGGVGALWAAPARAQSMPAPEAALARLTAGNVRFAARRLTSFDHDLAILRQHTEDKQEPFAAVLACADSRVPVELIFDQSIGHVFVTRVAGNVCTPQMIGSLEYGAVVLGVPLIMVLGHAGCGAVKAAIAGKPVPGQISTLFTPLRPAVERAGPDLEATIKANAQIQAGLLRTASPAIAALVAEGKVKVVAAYYELGSGRVSLLS